MSILYICSLTCCWAYTLRKLSYRKDTYAPVFTATLFTIARTWKQPGTPVTDEWKKKMWYVYTMEYYSAMKRNETESSVVMWIDLDSATQSEVSRLTSRNLSPTPVPSPSPPDPNHRSTVSFIPALMESSLWPSSQMNNQSHSYCTAFPTGCKSVQGPLNLLNGSKSSLISAMFCSGWWDQKAFWNPKAVSHCGQFGPH